MSNLLHDIQPWFDALSAGLWRATWQGSIAIAAVWLIVRYCRFIQPRAACWIWRLVCLKLLVSLIVLAPVNISVPVVAPTPAANQVAELSIAHEPHAEIEPEPNRPVQPARLPIVEPPVLEPVASNWNWLLALWAAGVVGCMWLTFGRCRAVRALRRASTANAVHLLDVICRQEAERLRVIRLPRLRTSSLIAVPLLAGIRRPVLLLPANAGESFDEHELQMIVAHELAHLKRHDLLWNWLATIVGWLFFFNPMVWLLKRAWADAQESACDELLVQNNSGIAVAYAELLIKVARQWPREPAVSLMAAGVLGTYQNLRRRILLMADIKPFSQRRLIAIASILLLAAAIGIIPWRLVAQQPQKADSAGDPATATDGKLAPETTTISGRVVDHSGKSVSGAEVILLGKEHIIVDADRRDWFVIPTESGGLPKPPSVRTNENGEFSITRTAVGLNRLAVIAADPLFWVASRKELGQSQGVEIKLPASGSLAVDCDLPGKRAKQPIEIELRTLDGIDWNADMLRFHFGEFSIKNPGETLFEHLPPAWYSVERAQMTPTGPHEELMTMADRRLVKVELDRRATVKVDRKVGRPLSGQVVGLEHADLRHAHVMITYFGPWEGQGEDRFQRGTAFDVIPITSDGRFTTDPIPPGKYRLDLTAYLSTTSNQSPQQSDFEGQVNFTIKANGQMPKVTVHAEPRRASADGDESRARNMLRVVDDAGQPVPKFELAAWTADKGNREGLIGSRGQIEQDMPLWGFNSVNAMDITLRADGYASTLAHFSGGDLEKLARGESRVVMRRGQQVEIRFRLFNGMTLPSDLRPEVYFSALKDKVECMWQPSNRRTYANLGDSLPDFNMLNVKMSTPGRFSFRLASQTEPFYVAINRPGFIRAFERGPFTWADVKDGVLTIDVAKPAAIDVRFDSANSDRGKLPFEGVTTMVMRRIDGSANSYLVVADADDTQKAPLRLADLAPGDYLITVRTKPKPDAKSILDGVTWPVNAGAFTDGRSVSLAAGQTKRVEFHYVPLDLQAFRGDRTAVLHILKPDGKPAVGRQITLGYADGHYGLLKVFSGPVPESGEISIAGLSDRSATDTRGTPYNVKADREQLGSFGFKTPKRSEDFTFCVPPDAGDAAPDVELSGVSSGKRIKLSSLRGKVVCLEFWASWCGPCREPMAKLDRLAADNRSAWKDNVAIVPISIDDSPALVRECVMQRGLNQLEHYWGGGGSGLPFSSPVARAFVIAAVPTALIIDRDGTIVWRGHPSVNTDGKNLMSRIEAVLRH